MAGKAHRPSGDGPTRDRPLEIDDSPVDPGMAAAPGAGPWSLPGATHYRATVSAGLRRPRRRGWVLALAAVLSAGAVAAVFAGVTSSGRDDRADRDDPADGGAPAAPPATVAAEERGAGPDQAIARAALALERAGTFAYHGEVRADGETAARPGVHLEGSLTVDGYVSFPARSVETAVGEGGAVETLISGRGVWVRRAADAPGLASAPWSLAQEGDGALGLTALADWMRMTVDRREGSVDDAGLRTYSGSLTEDEAGGLIGDAAPGAAGGLIVTVDAAGAPVRVELSVTARGRGLELALDLDGLGGRVDIAPPGGRELGATPAYSADDLVAAGLRAPVQLGALPPQWILAGATLDQEFVDASCPVLTLSYGEVGSVDRYVLLDVTSVGCGRIGSAEVGEPFGDGWTIDRAYENVTGSVFTVSNGVTRVEASSSLRLADLRALLASLGPYDQHGQPSLTAAEAGLP